MFDVVTAAFIGISSFVVSKLRRIVHNGYNAIKYRLLLCHVGRFGGNLAEPSGSSEQIVVDASASPPLSEIRVPPEMSEICRFRSRGS